MNYQAVKQDKRRQDNTYVYINDVSEWYYNKIKEIVHYLNVWWLSYRSGPVTTKRKHCEVLTFATL